jgi:hypothetical protein
MGSRKLRIKNAELITEYTTYIGPAEKVSIEKDHRKQAEVV